MYKIILDNIRKAADTSDPAEFDDSKVLGSGKTVIYYGATRAQLPYFVKGRFLSLDNGRNFYEIQSAAFDTLNGAINIKLKYDSISLTSVTTLPLTTYPAKVVAREQTLLDAEGSAITFNYAVDSLNDISARKDVVSNSFTLPNTPRNAVALGNLFRTDRYANATLSNRIGFNYSPTRIIDCRVVENGATILEGTFLVTETSAGASISYTCTIAGKFAGLKVAIGDNEMTDLDLTDTTHTYSVANISNGYTPSGRSQGVVYPFIDYGDKFTLSTLADFNTWTNMYYSNFRPAMFAVDLIKRIFEGAGCSIDLQGESADLRLLNSVIMPNADKVFGEPYNGQITLTSAPNGASSWDDHFWATVSKTDALRRFIPTVTLAPASNPLLSYTTPWAPTDTPGATDNMLIVNKIVTGLSIGAVFNIDVIEQAYSGSDGFLFQFCVAVFRSASGGFNGDPWSNVELLAATDVYKMGHNMEHPITYLNGKTVSCEGTGITLYPGDIVCGYVIGEKSIYSASSAKWENADRIKLTSLEISIPKNASDGLTLTPVIGDTITPNMPSGFKQLDFLKGVLNAFNLYIADDRNDRYKFYLMTRDYYFTKFNNLTSNANNLTKKVDFSKTATLTGNINLPKNYIFQFKEDSQVYRNDTYKKLFGVDYGYLTFNDSEGTADAQTIELPFAATIETNIGGQGRNYMQLSGTDVQKATTTATNSAPRLAFFRQGVACLDYNIVNELQGSSAAINTIATLSTYNYAGAVYYDISDGVPKAQLIFGRPAQYYFNATDDIVGAPTLYERFYIDTYTELTSINLTTVKLTVYLSRLDFFKLDFRAPVWIDAGKFGASYYKIVSLTYTDAKTAATLELKKVI